MKSAAPRHERFLARYTPLLSFAFLCFLGYAVNEHDAGLAFDEVPETLAGALGDPAFGHAPFQVHNKSPNLKLELTSFDKVVERNDRFRAADERLFTRAAVGPIEPYEALSANALAFLDNRPTRAGP